jgi:hypothetical protein
MAQSDRVPPGARPRHCHSSRNDRLPGGPLKAWLEAAAITEGSVFRPIAKGRSIQATRLTDGSVAAIVKAHAQRAGLDPKLCRALVALRLPDQLRSSGASIFKMADQSRVKRVSLSAIWPSSIETIVALCVVALRLIPASGR